MSAAAPAEALLRELAALILGVPATEVPLSVEFLDLGFTSLHLIGLVQSLEKRLRVKLTPALLFEHRTIGDFAGYLADTHADRLTGRSDSELLSKPEPTPDEEEEDRVVRALNSLIGGAVSAAEAERMMETGGMS
jgi:acyl carrier protein